MSRHIGSIEKLVSGWKESEEIHYSVRSGSCGSDIAEGNYTEITRIKLNRGERIELHEIDDPIIGEKAVRIVVIRY